MKLFALFLALVSFNSHADYSPGRERLVAEAELTVLSATGDFAGTQAAKMTQISIDGSNTAKYVLTLDGQDEATFVEVKSSETTCGDTSLSVHQQQNSVQMELTDWAAASCEIAVKHVWSINVKKTGESAESKLVLGGNPEFFLNTTGFSFGF